MQGVLTAVAAALILLTGAVVAPHSPEPARAETDEVLLVVAPGQTYDFALRSNGGPLKVWVRLYDGASLGGSLSGPGKCEQVGFSTNVIALSTSGQVIAVGHCGPVPAGLHTIRITSGSSSFVGSLHAANATFVA
jgi:hypothetical protein